MSEISNTDDLRMRIKLWTVKLRYYLLQIKVEDINEAPTGIDINDFRTVKENSEPGTRIGELYTLDSENYQNYTYTLLGVNYGQV